MELAKQIGIDRGGLIVNGKRFPFWLASEAVEVQTDPENIPVVRVALLAESVQIDPLLTVETDGDVQFVTISEEKVDE